ncbi:hypothetical protein QUF72_14105 [Desulfobacterales bacterium HSG2]|nr:hypothetical protein [Desulfobacterales bacterium HSG2]
MLKKKNFPVPVLKHFLLMLKKKIRNNLLTDAHVTRWRAHIVPATRLTLASVCRYAIVNLRVAVWGTKVAVVWGTEAAVVWGTDQVATDADAHRFINSVYEQAASD